MEIGSPIYSDREYAKMLLRLFPQGDAFPRIEGNSLWDFVLGLAQEHRRIDERLNLLVQESNPDAADELIEEYETDLSFPDESFLIPDLLVDRQAQVLNREIFPLYLPTGWTGAGTTEAGENVITGLSSTASVFIGDVVTISSEVGSGKYAVIDKTSSTITVEQTLLKSST